MSAQPALPAWLFQLLNLTSVVLPCAVAAMTMVLPWPRRALVRGIVATALGWTICVIFTIEVYNPVAIAYSSDDEIARFRYDNNTIAVSILSGWLFPAVVCLAMRMVAGIRCSRR